MGVQLLDRIRKINKLLHTNASNVFVFNDICAALADVLNSNVFVMSRKGKILGMGGVPALQDEWFWTKAKVGMFLPAELNERLLNVLSTQENVHMEALGFSAEINAQYHAILTPICIANERLGTFFIYRLDGAYGVDDIILAEYGASVIGLELLRSLSDEKAEELRNRQVVQSTLDMLSNLELEALYYVIDSLDGKEGILVASKVADRIGIAHSVIVNALRKAESSGVIESRSSGMRGTFLRVNNPYLRKELEKAYAERVGKKNETAE